MSRDNPTAVIVSPGAKTSKLKDNFGLVWSGGAGFLEDSTWIAVGPGVKVSETRLRQLLERLRSEGWDL